MTENKHSVRFLQIRHLNTRCLQAQYVRRFNTVLSIKVKKDKMDAIPYVSIVVQGSDKFIISLPKQKQLLMSDSNVEPVPFALRLLNGTVRFNGSF